MSYQIQETVNKLHQDMEPVREQTRLLVKASQQLLADWAEELKK